MDGLKSWSLCCLLTNESPPSVLVDYKVTFIFCSVNEVHIMTHGFGIFPKLITIALLSRVKFSILTYPETKPSKTMLKALDSIMHFFENAGELFHSSKIEYQPISNN